MRETERERERERDGLLVIWREDRREFRRVPRVPEDVTDLMKIRGTNLCER